MDYNDLMKDRVNNIENITEVNKKINVGLRSEINLVLDIEACPNMTFDEIKKQKSMTNVKALTYSIAIMDIDDNSDKLYWYNNVDSLLDMLLNLHCKDVNIYVHNLFYDIKPFITKFINNYNAKKVKDEIIPVKLKDYMNRKQVEANIVNHDFSHIDKEFKYNFLIKKGQLYTFTMSGKRFLGETVNLNFKDTYKVFPLSLKAGSKAFLDLDLSKEGLDYEKVRNVNDILTFEEMKYIYEDVFSLKYLVKMLIIDGFDCFGKLVKFSKLTNSSQSLYDYKETLAEDYEKNQNAFQDNNFKEYVENKLYMNNYYCCSKKASKYSKKLDKMFTAIYPVLPFSIDAFCRKAYYGGLSTVDFDNYNKFKKYAVKKGKVLDVNSLYPFTMQEFLLPYGEPTINRDEPYKFMSDDYKKQYPLYIQEITIHSMKVKKGKMEFVQVKDRKDFNGNDVLKENINLQGKKVSVKLTLCNPLIDLLFENYDVESYELGGHIAFHGTHNLFKNYLDFWGNVKKNSKGAKRQIAKLRQNALYGKFGTSGDTQEIELSAEDDKLSLTYKNDNYITDSVYIPMSCFITSWAKTYLVHAINNNRSHFMYCDTDSIHLFDEGQEIKGIEIDSKKYGAWDNEMNFTDFVYLGSKRYAEKEKESGKWEIKCCGLTDEIMKSINDINVFGYCEYSNKELKKLIDNDLLYTKKDDNYYYKDKECTIKVRGLIKSKKARIVPGGTLIIPQPYAIREKYLIFR